MRRPKPAMLGTIGMLSAALVLGCHSVPPPTPLDRLTAEETRGYNVFQSRCASCHNERSNRAKNGPPLVGIFKKAYLPSGAPANHERVSATILYGRGLMPAQPSIDPEELATLLAYLHTV